MMRLAITAFVLGAFAMGFSAQPAQADVTVSVTIGGFYDELAPYGRWVNCRYGRCWVPRRVSHRWQPYTNGRWVYTEYGWTWVSRDPWGGSPYHYGTWINLSGYGWSWVPGTVWAPAWVTWSYSDRYVGWAPLPPSFACGESGYSGRPVVVSQTQYVFVPTNRFVDTDVTSVWVPARQTAAIFRQTKPVTNFGISDGIIRNTGIPMETIQGATGGRIETRNISAANTTPRSVTVGGGGKGRQFAVVAPAREVNAAVAARPAPSSKAEKAPKAQKAPPAQSQRQAPQAVPAQERQPKAPKAQKAPPAQSQRQAPQAAPAQERQPRAPKAQKAPPAQSQRQAPPPRAEAGPGAQPAPAPAAQAAPPKQGQGHEKPARNEKEKDKRAHEKDKDKKDESH